MKSLLFLYLFFFQMWIVWNEPSSVYRTIWTCSHWNVRKQRIRNEKAMISIGQCFLYKSGHLDCTWPSHQSSTPEDRRIKWLAKSNPDIHSSLSSIAWFFIQKKLFGNVNNMFVSSISEFICWSAIFHFCPPPPIIILSTIKVASS